MKYFVFVAFLGGAIDIQARNLLDFEDQENLGERLVAIGFRLNESEYLKQYVRSTLNETGTGGVVMKIEMRTDSSGELRILRSSFTCTVRDTKSLESERLRLMDRIVDVVFTDEPTADGVRKFLREDRNPRTPRKGEFGGVRVIFERKVCDGWSTWKLRASNEGDDVSKHKSK